MPWWFVAAFAIGAASAVTAQMLADRGGELAVLAAVVAGLRTLAAVSLRRRGVLGRRKAHAQGGGD